MISTLNIKKYFIIIILFILITALSVNASTNNNLVNIYFFHLKDCTHCKNEIKLLNTLKDKYPNIKIYNYEIHDEENNKNRLDIQNLYNLKNSGVPLTIIGDTPYIGYQDETSPITFIKTIEYYSKYGYDDKVGRLLNIEQISNYQNKKAPTLENFLEYYGNYHLIGNLSTNDLDTSTNAIILGLLSQVNYIKIITIALVLTLLARIKEIRTRIYILISYAITTIFLNITNIIDNNIYITIIYIIILLLFIIKLIKFLNTSNQHYFINSIILVISFLSNNLVANTSSYFEAFKELIRLNNITGLNKISYYSNYLFTVLIFNIILIIIFHKLSSKINK